MIAAVAVQPPPRVATRVQHDGTLLAVWACHDAHACKAVFARGVCTLRAGHACLECSTYKTHSCTVTVYTGILRQVYIRYLHSLLPSQPQAKPSMVWTTLRIISLLANIQNFPADNSENERAQTQQ